MFILHFNAIEDNRTIQKLSITENNNIKKEYETEQIRTDHSKIRIILMKG